MLSRLITILIYVPLGIVLVILVVANFHDVTVTLDPVNKLDSGLSYTMPLAFWLIGALFVGALIGSAITWVGQHRYRSRARSREREAERLKRERDAAGGGSTSPAPLPASPHSSSPHGTASGPGSSSLALR